MRVKDWIKENVARMSDVFTMSREVRTTGPDFYRINDSLGLSTDQRSRGRGICTLETLFVRTRLALRPRDSASMANERSILSKISFKESSTEPDKLDRCL